MRNDDNPTWSFPLELQTTTTEGETRTYSLRDVTVTWSFTQDLG